MNRDSKFEIVFNFGGSVRLSNEDARSYADWNSYHNQKLETPDYSPKSGVPKKPDWINE